MKKLFLFLISIYTVFWSFGQTNGIDDQYNFFKILEDENAYWDSVLDTISADSLLSNEGSEYNRFLKWRNYYRERVPTNGDMRVINQELEYNFKNLQPSYSSQFQWRDIGPKDLPDITNHRYGIGPLNFFSFDPNFSTTQLMFTGSWSGGMYYSEDAGATWKNGGLDKIDFGIGMADCRSSHLDGNVWFVISGAGDGLYDNTRQDIIARGIYRTKDKGQTWEEIGAMNAAPFNGGNWTAQMKKILIDPRSTNNDFTIYITTSKGIFRTKNGMDTNVIWEKVFGIDDAIDFDSSNPSTVFDQCWAYDIKWIPESNNNTDGKIVATISKRSSFTTSNLNNDNRVCVGCNRHFTSSIIYSDPVNNTEIGDLGTWSELEIPDISSDFTESNAIVRISLGITPADNYNKLYLMAIGCWNNNKIYTYNWNTHTWNTSLSNILGWNGNGQLHTATIDVSPIDPNLIYVASSMDIAKSVNGGSSFTMISRGNTTFHDDVEDIKFTPNGNEIYLATHGGVYKANSQGASWFPMSNGISVAEVSDLSTSYTNPERMIIGLYHDFVQMSDGVFSDNWQPDWGKVSLFGDGMGTAINFKNPNYIYASTQDGYVKKINPNLSLGGQVDPPSGITEFDTDYQLNYFNPEIIYFPSTHVWRHDNYGGNASDPNWVQLSDFSIYNGNISETLVYKVFPSKTNSNILFVHDIKDGHHIYVTNKANESATIAQSSWGEIPYWDESPTSKWVTDIQTDPHNPNVFYLSTGYYMPWNAQGEYVKLLKYEYQGNLATDDLTQITLASFIITDISCDLPNIHVGHLFVNHGTPEFFVQTDLGVYYSNEYLIEEYLSGTSTTAWYIYGDNLPNCKKSGGIEPNYRSNMLRAGLFGRGVWEIQMPCEKLNQVFNINKNTVFDKIMRFRQDIIVKSGKTLTIKNTLYLAAGTKITVEPGATLTVDGGTITNACGDMWEGIVVLGDPTKAQSTTYQGRVYIKNNAVIEHAKTAISNVNMIPGNGIYPSGGMVYCSNSTFRNNIKDIEYNWYHRMSGTNELANVSSFTNCVFETTDDSRGTYTNAHLSFSDANGFNIKGNTFRDMRTNIDVLENGRVGIYAYETGFTLNEICTGPLQAGEISCGGDRNQFINLKKGVEAYGLSNPAQYSVNIKNTDFNCAEGIYLMDIDNADVLANQITVDPQYESDLGEKIYGLYLDYCTNYQVEGNEFEGVNLTDPYTTYGIGVKNQHGENTAIYRNTFNNLAVGTQAIGQNKSSNINTLADGLSIKCNKFSNSYYDVHVTDDDLNPQPVKGIALNQGIAGGNTTQLAGNLFGTSSTKHIHNSTCAYFNYYHHNPSTQPRVVPSLRQGNAIGVFGYPFINFGTSSCPESWAVEENPIGLGGTLSMAIEQRSIIESTDQTLKTLVDGGNTTELKQDVVYANNQDAYDKYSDLMSKEGYLSEEVLEEVAAKETALNKAMVRDVLVANPQAAKSEKVQSKLDQRADQLPEYMRAQIQEGLTRLSAKEYLELRKAKAKAEHDRIINDLVRAYSKDSIDRTPEILNALSNTGDINFEYRKLAILDAQGRTAEAEQVLSLMQQMPHDQIEQKNLQDYTEVRNLLKNWKQMGKNMNTLDSAAIATLKGYQWGNNKAAAKAISVLKANGHADYEAPLYWDNSDNNRSSFAEWSKADAPKSEANLMVAYPNPANEYVTVEYSFVSNDKPIVLSIIDAQGKVVYSKSLQYTQDQVLINTSSLIKGSYMIRLSAGKKTIKSLSLQIDK